MNVERLNFVASKVLDEMVRSGVVEKLRQLKTHLDAFINTPQQPKHEQQMTATLQDLKNTLSESPLDEEGESIQQALRELDVQDILGNTLRETLVTAFETNGATPSAIPPIINPLAVKATTKRDALKALTQSLVTLGIQAEELGEDECEISFVIPREKYEGSLEKLASEISQYTMYLQTFDELVTGKRNEVRVQTISSSNFTVYLIESMDVGLAILKMVVGIVVAYKTVLEIKSLREKSKAHQLPESVLTGMDEHASKVVEKAIQATTDTLMEESASTTLTEERKNELKIQLNLVGNEFAMRIDKNFGIEIRVAPPKELPEALDDEEVDEETMRRRELQLAAREIYSLQSKVENFRRLEGPPLLQLPSFVDEVKESLDNNEPKAKPAKKTAKKKPSSKK